MDEIRPFITFDTLCVTLWYHVLLVTLRNKFNFVLLCFTSFNSLICSGVYGQIVFFAVEALTREVSARSLYSPEQKLDHLKRAGEALKEGHEELPANWSVMNGGPTEPPGSPTSPIFIIIKRYLKLSLVYV